MASAAAPEAAAQAGAESAVEDPVLAAARRVFAELDRDGSGDLGGQLELNDMVSCGAGGNSGLFL